MNPTNVKYDELIFGFLRGKNSSEESQELFAWIAESDENRAYFESLKNVWEISSPHAAEIKEDDLHLDVEAALSKVNHRIDLLEENQSGSSSTHQPWFQSKFRLVASIAAMVAVVMLAFWGIRNSYLHSDVTVCAADLKDMSQPFILPDGTSVKMEENSVLTYPRRFDEDQRTIEFSGDAFFDVSKNPAQPFVINCGNVSVEVLGTSFFLNAQPDAEKYTLDLVSGKVKMFSKDSEGVPADEVILNPGQRGVYSASSQTLGLLTEQEVRVDNAITSGVLDFNNETLSEVITMLESVFDLQIDLDPAYSDLRMTARFDGDSADSILKTIITVFGFEMIEDGSHITIQ